MDLLLLISNIIDSIDYQQIIDSIIQLNEEIQIQTKQHDGIESVWVSYGPVFVPLICFFSYILYNNFLIRKWRKGIFPSDLEYNKTNLMEAYCCLTVYFITLDRHHQLRKIQYLTSYFSKTYNYDIEKIEMSIDRVLHYPIHPFGVTDWLNKHTSESFKKQLLEFLVHLTFIDNNLKSKEYEALKTISRALHLNPSFLDEIMFSKKEQTQSKESSNKKTHQKPTPSPSVLQQHADLLGVSLPTNEKEVKQRYRQLAKKYHPDKFARESKEQQKQAHQRFIEIQEAYDYLINSI